MEMINIQSKRIIFVDKSKIKRYNTNKIYTEFQEDFMIIMKKAGILLISALALAALVFTGCQDDDPAKAPVPPETWIAIESEAFGTTTIQKVVFGDDKFVTTGNGSSAWHSTDGITWIASTGKDALKDEQKEGDDKTNNLSGLAFGDGKFLTTGGSSGNTVRAYSDDGGVTWKASGKGFNCKGLAYGNGVFLTGGSSGRIAYSSDPADDTSWETLENTVTTFNAEGKNGFVNAIAFDGGKFVAAGSNYGHAAYSTDGETWNTITQTEEIFAGWINGIACGGGKFVAVGDGGKAAYASASSVSDWTAVVDTKLTGNILGIAYGNGHFVAVDNAGAAAWSADGITWTVIADTKFDNNGINGVTYGNGKFIIVGANGKAAYAAVD
jgi:hypothetical protein